MAEINVGKLHVLRIFQVKIILTILNGIKLWDSIGSLFVGVQSEPFSEENLGPIRKYYLDSPPWRYGLAAYLHIFSG